MAHFDGDRQDGEDGEKEGHLQQQRQTAHEGIAFAHERELLALQFEPDITNSGLGDEISLPGWTLSGFAAEVTPKTYKSNYGDTSLPTDAESTYSRLTFGMDMHRQGWGSAIKLLSTVIFATLVAFVAFGIKPSDVDPRFGLGIGALFFFGALARFRKTLAQMA